MRRSASAQLQRRMLEPVAHVFTRRLLVPKIYFEARWPRDEEERVDMVVVDRSGTGDVHIVEIQPSARSALAMKTTNRLIQLPANYLWLAFPAPRSRVDYSSAPLYQEDGAGRIGIIEVVERPGDTFGAEVVWPAERFHEQLQDVARTFVKANRPDITFR